MKTKEFIAKMKELGYYVDTVGDTIVVKVLSPNLGASIDVHGWFKIKNTTKDAYLVISEGRLIPQSDTNVLLAIAEYLSTPAGEREEKKEYWLRCNSEFEQELVFLNFNKVHKKYLFMGRVETPNYQTQFTQKEIDAMPFDTNFFVKLEVVNA